MREFCMKKKIYFFPKRKVAVLAVGSSWIGYMHNYSPGDGEPSLVGGENMNIFYNGK